MKLNEKSCKKPFWKYPGVVDYGFKRDERFNFPQGVRPSRQLNSIVQNEAFLNHKFHRKFMQI